MTTRRAVMVLGAALAMFLSGVSAAAQAQTLTVSAAASLTNALKEVGSKFEAERPGVKLQYNFAASGVLIQQISQGAPVDLFISADQETMARGVEQKLLDPATQRDFAANTLVLITPLAGAPALKSLADLNTDAVKRIAIGKLATVPVGRYTKQALEANKLWTAVEPKLVYADSVRQVLDYVARGEVEAGFVYRTDAALMPDKVKIVLQTNDHTPVRYPLAVVSESRQKPLAQAFADYLFSPASQAILARYGFGKP
jgi:molybdate transport system substrate-binding protein